MSDGIEFDGFSRRSALKIIAGVGIGSIATGTVAGTGRAMVDYDGGGGNNPWRQHDKHRLGEEDTGSYTDRHLGSGLESIGNNWYRVAGDFCIVDENGNLQQASASKKEPYEIDRSDAGNPGAVGTQKVRIHNESPGGLSIFKSENHNEIGMNPKPSSSHDDNLGSTVGFITGAASLAAGAVSAPTAGLALGAASLVSGMYGIYEKRTKDPGYLEWSNYYGYGNLKYAVYRGGHHVNFGIREHGGGTVWVASEIDHVVNSWRMHFNDGLRKVEEL